RKRSLTFVSKSEERLDPLGPVGIRARLIAAVYLGRRRRSLDGGEWLEDLVAVSRTRRHQPRVTGLKSYGLPLQLELRPAIDDISDRFVLAHALGFPASRLLLLPEAHGNALARHEIRLPHFALGRIGRVDLLHRCVRHRMSSGLRPAGMQLHCAASNLLRKPAKSDGVPPTTGQRSSCRA